MTVFALVGLCATAFAQEETGVEINGVTWATRNVDAPGTFAATPEDAGMYYRWNSKIGWNNSGEPSDGTSVWNAWDGGDAGFWESVNDPCPIGWRIPTLEDFEKLIAADFEWVTEPAKGYRFYNGDNFIFISAIAGVFQNGNLYDENFQSIYWCSDLKRSYYFYAGGFDYQSGDDYNGFCVRCVKAEGDETAVTSVLSEAAAVVGYYSITGQRLPQVPEKGIYIIKYDNGKTEKRMK